MRTVSVVLACIAASAISLAVADQSNTTEPQATSTPGATQPAAPTAVPAAPPAASPPAATATAATAAAPAVDPEERHLIAMGYKPKVRNGVRLFCRYEDELGSRLGHKERCGTAADWKTAEAATHDDMEEMRRQALKVNPAGK